MLDALESLMSRSGMNKSDDGERGSGVGDREDKSRKSSGSREGVNVESTKLVGVDICVDWACACVLEHISGDSCA